jgi:hypothetical protein
MKSILSIILISILAFPGEGFQLRLINGEKETFKKLSIVIGDKMYKFENFNSGDITEPIFLDGSYSYFLTCIITENDTIITYPASYKGQRFYTSGKLTVKLTVAQMKDKKVICFEPLYRHSR